MRAVEVIALVFGARHFWLTRWVQDAFDPFALGHQGFFANDHMNGEAFKILAGVDLVHVPYKGSAPMAIDLLAGRVEVGFPAVNNVKSNLGSGKIKVLAVLDPQRYTALPEVPTLAEIMPEFRKAATWTAVFGPAGLPTPIVNRLNNAFLRALEAPEVRKFMDENGAAIRGGSPQDLAAVIRQDLEATAKLIKTVGIKPE